MSKKEPDGEDDEGKFHKGRGTVIHKNGESIILIASNDEVLEQTFNEISEKDYHITLEKDKIHEVIVRKALAGE